MTPSLLVADLNGNTLGRTIYPVIVIVISSIVAASEDGEKQNGLDGIKRSGLPHLACHKENYPYIWRTPNK